MGYAEIKKRREVSGIVVGKCPKTVLVVSWYLLVMGILLSASTGYWLGPDYHPNVVNVLAFIGALCMIAGGYFLRVGCRIARMLMVGYFVLLAPLYIIYYVVGYIDWTETVLASFMGLLLLGTPLLLLIWNPSKKWMEKCATWNTKRELESFVIQWKSAKVIVKIIWIGVVLWMLCQILPCKRVGWWAYDTDGRLGPIVDPDEHVICVHPSATYSDHKLYVKVLHRKDQVIVEEKDLLERNLGVVQQWKISDANWLSTCKDYLRRRVKRRTANQIIGHLEDLKF